MRSGFLFLLILLLISCGSGIFFRSGADDVPAEVTAVSPTLGGHHTLLTVRGTGFVSGISVTVGGVRIDPLNAAGAPLGFAGSVTFDNARKLSID